MFVLRDHVQNNLNTLLCKEPNALVLLTGDFNPTSTGFKMKYRLSHRRTILNNLYPSKLETLPYWIGC